MRDNATYDDISFNLDFKIMREFNNNLSSGESHDYSISFEPQSREFIVTEDINELITNKRPKRKKFPEEINSIAEDFVNGLFSKYKNILFQVKEKGKEIHKINFTESKDYIENNLIIQGNNINDIRNLKNFKNENAFIQMKSPINKTKKDFIASNNESNEEIRKNLFSDKSNSITNSNINTNPSTVYKSDSINHYFQKGLIKEKSVKYLVLPSKKSLINVKNVDGERTIKTINSEEMESSNNNGVEKSINLILNPKDNEKLISIDDLRKRYRLSDEISNCLIERRNLNLDRNSLEQIKDINYKTISYRGEELNKNKEDFLMKSIIDKDRYENDSKFKNSKNESNQVFEQTSIHELILPTCLKTNSISILSINDKINSRLQKDPIQRKYFHKYKSIDNNKIHKFNYKDDKKIIQSYNTKPKLDLVYIKNSKSFNVVEKLSFNASNNPTTTKNILTNSKIENIRNTISVISQINKKDNKSNFKLDSKVGSNFNTLSLKSIDIDKLKIYNPLEKENFVRAVWLGMIFFIL